MDALNHISRWLVSDCLWPIFWESSLLFLIVLLAARTLFRKAAPQVHYLLWLLVIARCFCPPSLGLFSAIRRLGALLPTPWRSHGIWVSGLGDPMAHLFRWQTMGDMEGAPGPALLAAARGASAFHAPSWFTLLVLLWLLGLTCLLSVLIKNVRAYRRMLRKGRPLSGPLAAMAEGYARQLGFFRRIRFMVTEEFCVPAAFGLLRPTVLLPADVLRDLDEKELAPIILHELIHIRRRDHLVNWLQILAGLLLFFHPLIWMANRRIRMARERVCDDRVLVTLAGRRRSYALSLLKVAERVMLRPQLAWSGPLNVLEPGAFLRERVVRILDRHHRPSARLPVVWLAALLVFALFCGALAGGDDGGANGVNGKRIKVGVLASYYTATGPICKICYHGKPLGFGVIQDCLGVFQNQGYDLYAIIEPGSLAHPEFRALLAKNGLLDRVVDGADPAALRQLDVMVSIYSVNITPEVGQAMTEAVRRGTKFLVLNSFGVENRGLTEPVLELLGLRTERYLFYTKNVPCRVTQAHPLLGGLPAGSIVVMPALNGLVGEPREGATPLLESTIDCKDESHQKDGGGVAPARTIQPLTVRRFGAGLVVRGIWWSDLQTTMKISSAQFIRRSVNWLAEQ